MLQKYIFLFQLKKKILMFLGRDCKKTQHSHTIFFLTKANKPKNKKKDMQIPQGSGAAAVKVAGHFFIGSVCGSAKKWTHPEGLTLTAAVCAGLWGTAFFCISFFLFIKYFYRLLPDKSGWLAGAWAGKGKRMASAIFLRGVGNAKWTGRAGAGKQKHNLLNVVMFLRALARVGTWHWQLGKATGCSLKDRKSARA